MNNEVRRRRIMKLCKKKSIMKLCKKKTSYNEVM